MNPGELHLWLASLDDCGAEVEAWSGTLPAPIRERVGRLATPALRRRALAGERLRRVILSRYVGARPEEVRFALTPSGKPFLQDAPDLQFSLSHSGALFLIGIRVDAPVGVDIEVLRPVRDPLGVAARALGPEAVAAIREAEEPGVRARVFFRHWTRGEAVVKGIGAGHPFASPTPDGWWVDQVPLSTSQAVAAAATPGDRPTLVIRSWPGDAGELLFTGSSVSTGARL